MKTTSVLVAAAFASLAACGSKQPLPQDVGVPTSNVDPVPATSASAEPGSSAPLPSPTGDRGAPPAPPPPADTASPDT